MLAEATSVAQKSTDTHITPSGGTLTDAGRYDLSANDLSSDRTHLETGGHDHALSFGSPLAKRRQNLEQAQLLKLRDNYDEEIEQAAEQSHSSSTEGGGTIDIVKEADEAFCHKVGVVIQLAIPSILCTLIFYFQEMVNVYFVSHLNDKVMVSAVGLGNMIQNTFIVSVMCSFNSVVETLVSQAAGSGNLEVCGVYLNRAIIVLFIAFSISTTMIFHSKTILLALGQDPMVAQLTQSYLVY